MKFGVPDVRAQILTVRSRHADAKVLASLGLTARFIM